MKANSDIGECVANFKQPGFGIIFLFLGSMLFFMMGCGKEEGAPAEMFYAYFPDTPGHFVIYNVDSVVYDDFTGQTLTFQYQVKEVIESRFPDGEGRESLRLERFIRESPQHSWEIKNIWQARVLPSRAEKTEENVTFVKLVFPPARGKTWNGNAYNTLQDQTYRITDAHQPYLISPTLSFDSTVTVLQNSFTTLISEDFQEEKYAKHVGLVYKRFRQVTKQADGTIIRGVDYTYQVAAFGKE